jgi:hypothetical protein
MPDYRASGAADNRASYTAETKPARSAKQIGEETIAILKEATKRTCPTCKEQVDELIEGAFGVTACECCVDEDIKQGGTVFQP